MTFGQRVAVHSEFRVIKCTALRQQRQKQMHTDKIAKTLSGDKNDLNNDSPTGWSEICSVLWGLLKFSSQHCFSAALLRWRDTKNIACSVNTELILVCATTIYEGAVIENRDIFIFISYSACVKVSAYPKECQSFCDINFLRMGWKEKPKTDQSGLSLVRNICREELREDISAVWPSHILLGLLPWMTWELSFRKKLYKYLGMKVDMQAYARAGKRKKQKITDKSLKC